MVRVEGVVVMILYESRFVRGFGQDLLFGMVQTAREQIQTFAHSPPLEYVIILMF